MISGYEGIPLNIVDKAKKLNYYHHHQDQHRTNNFRCEAGQLM